jgi:hypothetical protein
VGLGQNTFHIIGKSKKEDVIDYLDSDDLIKFKMEVCNNFVTVNVGAEVSSEIDMQGPYKVNIKTKIRQGVLIATGKICNKRRKCFEVNVPTSIDQAGCV